MSLSTDNQRSATQRDAVNQQVQATVERRVKEQLQQAAPQLETIVQKSAQAAASQASNSLAGGSATVSFSAAQKSSLVGTTVDAVVEQLGAGLPPAYKSALKSQLTDTINYALRGELAKVESNAAEQRRKLNDEVENGAMAGRLGSAKGNTLLGAGALFGKSANAFGQGEEDANSASTPRTFGFGNKAAVANAAGIADPISQPSVAQAISNANPVAAAEPIAQRTPQPIAAAAMSLKDIELAISGAFKNMSKETTTVRDALAHLRQPGNLLANTAGRPVDSTQLLVARETNAAGILDFATQYSNASDGSFRMFLKNAA